MSLSELTIGSFSTLMAKTSRSYKDFITWKYAWAVQNDLRPDFRLLGF